MKTSRLFKTAPFLLMGIGGIGFGRWCVAGWESRAVMGAAHAEQQGTVTGQAGSSGVTAQAAAVHGPKAEPPEAHGNSARPMQQPGKVSGGVARGKELPIVADAVRAAVPSSQSETPEAVSVPSRTRTAKSFTIPAALADRPLPVFVRFSGALEENAVAEAGTLVPSPPGVAALPSTGEQRILAEAERIFAEAMDQSPVQEASAPEYEDWWRAAQARSENYLRLSLGWDRFNTLRRAELKALSDPSPQDSLQAGAMESSGE